ncbi:hypothetical protein [Clostridium sp. AM58-1XD]|uniref:hypothetical protein n=1 Tax=Clostridium sp. AM58-1XD TaxID=2292307 RepID=UPI000E50E050|nr:hypothetical protein [Clostridium sp. AM58-1XD]RGY95388.1 hypothetical protein DXA13_19405 [Clostridium sp. AM58-1XD]
MKQKRVRDFTWKDYGISPYRYRELKNFCLQYIEKKKKIRYGLSAVRLDGMPGKSGNVSPVEMRAFENLKNEQDCRMIEEAAKAASSQIWRYLLKSVTEDVSFEMLEYDTVLGRIPMGKTDFYGYRRLFYRNLDRLKNGDKLSAVG